MSPRGLPDSIIIIDSPIRVGCQPECSPHCSEVVAGTMFRDVRKGQVCLCNYSAPRESHKIPRLSHPGPIRALSEAPGLPRGAPAPNDRTLRPPTWRRVTGRAIALTTVHPALSEPAADSQLTRPEPQAAPAPEGIGAQGNAVRNLLVPPPCAAQHGLFSADDQSDQTVGCNSLGGAFQVLQRAVLLSHLETLPVGTTTTFLPWYLPPHAVRIGSPNSVVNVMKDA